MSSTPPSKIFTKRSVQVVVGLLLCGGIALGTVSAWPRIAVAVAPAKTPATSRSTAAAAADQVFWSTFHGGHYDAIQPAIEQMTAAYLETPGDALTAAHVAWLHTWRAAERARVKPLPPTITDDVVLARKYFHEAAMLDPSEARFRGFLASQMLAEAHIDHNERLTREGYYLMVDAVKAWPEFNLFTAGYVMSDLPPDSPRFKEGLEQQWENMEVCVGEHIDRARPDYAKYMSLETKTGKKRACWNSWIAPHNLEGFFLNMGDMLVKAGDVPTARAIYQNTKASKEYGAWKYQSVLEDRIARAEENVTAFRSADPAANTIMLTSRFACMGCHEE